MAQPLGTDLVIAQPEVGSVPRRHEVVALVEGAVAGQHERPLLGEHVVQLELADLQVGPAGPEQVVEPDERGLDPDSLSIRNRGYEPEGDVLVERPQHQEVGAGDVEARLGDGPLHRPAGGIPRYGVHRLVGRALQAPLRGGADAEGDVGGVLPDRRVTIVAELVASVLEPLAERVELGPRGVTGRTWQAVLPGEGRDRRGLVNGESVASEPRQHPSPTHDIRFIVRPVSGRQDRTKKPWPPRVRLIPPPDTRRARARFVEPTCNCFCDPQTSRPYRLRGPVVRDDDGQAADSTSRVRAPSQCAGFGRLGQPFSSTRSNAANAFRDPCQ